MTKNEFQLELYKNKMTDIVFLKVDGSERKMTCLRPDLISDHPEVSDETSKKMRKVNESVMNVFSVEDNGWRSFRLENLISINNEVIENVQI